MPQLNRMYCSNCKKSIFLAAIDGVRVPLVMYFVVGQPPDTGEPFDANASGVRLPSFVREMLHPSVPTARVELCIPCVMELFGLPAFTAEADPMFSEEQADATGAAIDKVRFDASIQEVDKHHATMQRVLTAIKVGRGAVPAPPLPPKPVTVSESPAVADVVESATG